jgi:LAGLIDADG DNA endonuclease family
MARFRSHKINPKIGPIPQKVQDLLVGYLLGDCSGELQAPSLAPSFVFKQGEVHAPWIFFLYFILLHWGYVNLSFPIVYWSKATKFNITKKYPYLRFRTLANSSLLWLYNEFDSHGVKKVPANIEHLMNARVLATWIADDGSWHVSGILLHCNSFSHSETLRLISCLYTSFGIRATPRANYNQTIIDIPAKYISVLRSLVLPYLHPTFIYKIGL